MSDQDQPKTKMVETYAEDMAEVIKDDHGSLIKKIIHEEESREEEKMIKSPEARRNKLFAFLGSLLILVSVAIVGFFILNNKASTINVETPFTAMIFTDETAFIEVADLNKDQIVQSVREEVETKEVKPGGIEGIYLTLDNNIVGLRQFLTLLEGNFVIYENNFIDDNFLLGFMNVGVPGAVETSREFFILIKMRSFTDVFQSARGWEDKMFFDLQGLFDIALSSDTAPLLTQDFNNGIVQNKNARILYQKDADSKNRIAMMYVFVDDTHMVVTRSEEVVREIITRLLGSNLTD